jgi:hypothetical protein
MSGGALAGQTVVLTAAFDATDPEALRRFLDDIDGGQQFVQ